MLEVRRNTEPRAQVHWRRSPFNRTAITQFQRRRQAITSLMPASFAACRWSISGYIPSMDPSKTLPFDSEFGRQRFEGRVSAAGRSHYIARLRLYRRCLRRVFAGGCATDAGYLWGGFQYRHRSGDDDPRASRRSRLMCSRSAKSRILGRWPGRSWDLPDWYAAPGKAERLLDWTAKTDLASGLRLTSEWVRSLEGLDPGDHDQAQPKALDVAASPQLSPATRMNRPSRSCIGGLPIRFGSWASITRSFS